MKLTMGTNPRPAATDSSREASSSKRCSGCGATKTAEEFGISRNRPDGLQSRCKACRYAQAAASDSARRRTDRVFRDRERANGRRKAKKPNHAAARRTERRVVGSAEWARARVLQARLRGELIKPGACERCGAEPPRHQLHGHHWHGDYANRPLEVEWLCSLCHGSEHSQRGGTHGQPVTVEAHPDSGPRDRGGRP